MPSKHDPPSDSSSSSEEEEEEVAASRDVEKEEEDEDEDDDDEEEEEDTTPVKPSKPNPTSNSVHPQPPSDDSDESESESDESDSPTPTVPLDIKPISSKPMTSSSSSKPQRPTVVALATAKKRPETDEKDPRKDKKKKKKVADLVDEDHAEKQPVVDDPKKNLFQRLWTEDDEVVILKGMLNFKKKGMDVNSHLSAFVDTIKDSLHISDVSKTQVQSKIRTLKRKFQNAAKKAKPGEDPGNLKPHDAKLYQLSKKVWLEEIGKEGKDNDDERKSAGDNVAKGDDKKSKSKKVPDSVASPPNPKVTTLPTNNTTTTMEVGRKDDDKKSSLEYFCLTESRGIPNYPMMPAPPLGLGDFVVKRGRDVIGSSKAQKLDERWKNVIIAETKAYLQRLDLVKEQTQAMLDALESSNV